MLLGFTPKDHLPYINKCPNSLKGGDIYSKQKHLKLYFSLLKRTYTCTIYTIRCMNQFLHTLDWKVECDFWKTHQHNNCYLLDFMLFLFDKHVTYLYFSCGIHSLCKLGHPGVRKHILHLFLCIYQCKMRLLNADTETYFYLSLGVLQWNYYALYISWGMHKTSVSFYHF